MGPHPSNTPRRSPNTVRPCPPRGASSSRVRSSKLDGVSSLRRVGPRPRARPPTEMGPAPSPGSRCSKGLRTEMTPVDLPTAQSVRAVPGVEQPVEVRTGEHCHAFLPSVTLADRFRVTAGQIPSVSAVTAPDPTGGWVVGAGIHTARPIWRLSQSDSHRMALRPALSTTRVL